MNYRAIIRDAWVMTQSNKKLIWTFAFVPALLTTIVFMGYMVYQFFALRTSGLFGGETKDLFSIIAKKLWQFIGNHPGVGVFLIVVASVLGLVWLMLPVFTQGALIQLLGRARRGEEISILDGIGLGFRRFLQLFEYHLAIKSFGFVSVFTNAVFFLRSLGLEAFGVFIWIFLLIFVVGIFLTLLFTYSEYFICLNDQGMFKSMMASSSMVVRHWHHTFFMLLLMSFITLRIVINIAFAMLLPLLVMGPILFFTSVTLVKIGVVVGGIVGLVGLYFASYFVGVFNVFTTAVWTFTFLELHEKK
ncbi:hypothetical protein HOH67_02605 [Candidatus Peregrinibacteria bacterium]|jgi:hypothetical protein|nr:hypothetical protein [Candidatus Peregrinibacteria bacterium]